MIIQVTLAFLIGGFAIALLSLIAEKAPLALRGIVISFPSTLAISFIFLSHEFGPEILLKVLPNVFYSLFGSFLFAITFVVVAQHFADKTPTQKWPIAVTLIAASLVWLIVALLTSNLPRRFDIALTTYAMVTILIQPLLWNYALHHPSSSISHKTTLSEFFARTIFAGTVVATALIVSKTLSPFWGAVVGGTFPAAFGSQLMIFQNKYPASQLPTTIKTIPLGVTSTAFYAILVAMLYPNIGMIWGTAIGILGSLVFSLVLAYAVKRFSAKHQP